MSLFADKLKLGLGLDFSQLDGDVDEASARIARGLGSASFRPGAASPGAPAVAAPALADGLSAGAASASAGLTAGLRSALAAGLSPLGSIGGRLALEFDRVGGTVVTLARRIDNAMKFPAIDAAVSSLRTRLGDAFRWGAGMAARSSTDIATLLKGLDVTIKGLAASFRSVGTAAGAVSQIVRELGGDVAAAEARASLLSRTWERLKGLAPVAPDAIPPAGQRPGRGRAVPLGARPAPVPRDAPGPGVGTRGLAAAKAAIDALKGSVGTLAVGLERVYQQSDRGFARMSARGTKLGEVLQALGKTFSVGNQFKVMVAGSAAAAGSVLALGQAVFRLQNYFSSLGDVAGKSYGEIFREGGLLGAAIGVPAKAVVGLTRGLFNLGTLGVFRKQAAEAGVMRSAVGTLPAAVNKTTASLKGLATQALAAFGVMGLFYETVQIFRGGIKGAIDLSETVNKVGETFGKSTDVVTAQADRMAKAFGLPKGAMLDAASSIGLVAKGAGQADAQAAGMANTLARLAADASSFYNVPLETALEKIRSGLVGEAEPLRAFGVLLSEEAVKAEAVRLGLGKGTKALDEKSKVTARASLIAKGLATAEGDLERTAGGAANQFRQAGGGIGNFATSIGELLLPAVTGAITSFNELLATVVDVFEANKPLIQGWADGVKTAVDEVGFVLRNLGSFWEVAQLKVKEFALNVVAVLETLPANFAVIGEYLANNWSKLVLDGLAAVGTGVMNLGENLANFGAALFEFFKDPLKGFTFSWKPLLEGFRADAEALPELIRPALVSVQSEIDKVGEKIAEDERKRAARLAGKPGQRKRPADDGKEADKDGPVKLAGLAELGSKEAYKTLALHRAGGDRGDDGIKGVAKNTGKHVREAEKQTVILNAIAGKLATGPAAPPIYSFG